LSLSIPTTRIAIFAGLCNKWCVCKWMCTVYLGKGIIFHGLDHCGSECYSGGMSLGSYHSLSFQFLFPNCSYMKCIICELCQSVQFLNTLYGNNGHKPVTRNTHQLIFLVLML
jgi:hypothetical protein